MTDSDATLHRVLGTLAEHGHIGQTVADALDHSERFVRALPPGAASLIDLGSGGGIPALVIAVARRDLTLTLVERRRTRADELVRAVHALHVEDRVTVAAVDAMTMDTQAEIVTARSFAAPEVTLAVAARLLRPGGIALISDPPSASIDHWRGACDLVEVMVDRGSHDGIHRFERR